MNASDPMPRRGNRFDLDGLLHTFFHTEMPRPWPQWHAPSESLESSPGWRRRSLTRSRDALAAGLLILATGYAGLAQHTAEPSSGFEATSERWDGARRSRPVPPRRADDPAQRPPHLEEEGWLPERR